MRFILASVFITLTCLPTLRAQMPVACGGGAAPAIACEQACISCNFNGFSGSTTGYPTGVAPDYCGTVENFQWLGFIAGENAASFIVTANNCSDGNGVQIAIYQDCMASPLDCDKGEANGAGIPVSVSIPMQPGTNYFLLIDGYAGDQCDFTVTVDPPSAVYEPPLGVVGAITGPTALCPGATRTYSVQPVNGAGAYIWTGPPGTLFDSLPSPATFNASEGLSVEVTIGDVGGEICVQAANVCNQNAACTASIDVEILGPDAWPVIQLDDEARLNCTDVPLAIKADVLVGSQSVFLWTPDTTGNITSGSTQSTVRVNQTGVYYLHVLDETTGCSNRDSVTVLPPELPRDVAMWVRNCTCYGDGNGELGIDSLAGSLPPFMYSLDGSGMQPTNRFSYLTPGDHTLRIEGADGCVWDTAFVITEPAELLVDLGPDDTIHLGESTELWFDGVVNYPDRVFNTLVSPAMLEPMLCDTCVYFPTNSFKYLVEVRDSNGCNAL
ncbi:MAG: hypothetical protein IT270_06380, partial [Saprospiraceae bacterium]|nr:hypothetical protein [Saprospiraceae bacterium]